MKQKFKNTKGITLVALIITIIVLLILAVVAITSISKSDIIGYARNGAEAYTQTGNNETEKLTEYVQFIDNNTQKSTEPEFPNYGAVYSCSKKSGEISFLIINKSGVSTYYITWDGSDETFGDIPNTTYDDFRTTERATEQKYTFVDLVDAVNEDMENQGELSDEEKEKYENIKTDTSYCSRAIKIEAVDEEDTCIEFYYFKNNYNQIINDLWRENNIYSIEEKFNNENKEKLIELINNDTIYEK